MRNVHCERGVVVTVVSRVFAPRLRKVHGNDVATVVVVSGDGLPLYLPVYRNTIDGV
jgi:hypothetical protein